MFPCDLLILASQEIYLIDVIPIVPPNVCKPLTSEECELKEENITTVWSRVQSNHTVRSPSLPTHRPHFISFFTFKGKNKTVQ